MQRHCIGWVWSEDRRWMKRCLETFPGSFFRCMACDWAMQRNRAPSIGTRQHRRHWARWEFRPRHRLAFPGPDCSLDPNEASRAVATWQISLGRIWNEWEGVWVEGAPNPLSKNALFSMLPPPFKLCLVLFYARSPTFKLIWLYTQDHWYILTYKFV